MCVCEGGGRDGHECGYGVQLAGDDGVVGVGERTIEEEGSALQRPQEPAQD